MNKAIPQLLLIFLLATPVCYAQDWITWVEHPDNPVLDPDTRAYYPCVVFDASLFSSNGVAVPYKVWYQTESGIAHATSFDGEDWTIIGDIAGLVSTAAHPWVIYDPDGFDESVPYKMWYWTSIGELTTVNSIHYAESSDGVNWVNDQAITQDATYPLVTAVYGTWWYHLYGPACLLYDPSALNMGDNPYDYNYVMLFDTAYEGGGTEGIEAVALAYSADGKHWTRYGDAPIFLPSNGEWDGEYVTRGTLLPLPFGGYGFWYSGGVADSNDGIGYAESVDGLLWLKEVSPIMHQDNGGYPGAPWRSERSYTPMVIYDPDLFSGYGAEVPYKMWYSGRNPDDGEYTVGVTYGERQVPVGGKLVPVEQEIPRWVFYPFVVTLLIGVLLMRKRV